MTSGGGYDVSQIYLVFPHFSISVVPLLIFVISLFTFYSTMTIVIQLTSATAVNLSILSADFYTLLFGLFLFSYKVNISSLYVNYTVFIDTQDLFFKIQILMFFSIYQCLVCIRSKQWLLLDKFSEKTVTLKR